MDKNKKLQKKLEEQVKKKQEEEAKFARISEDERKEYLIMNN